ncbi:MAG: Mov34/MPN/PAD-1 family protein [Thermoplasmata archaeon]
MRRRARSIRRETLEMILEASRDTYPMEFGAILRAEGGVVSEILLVPGTIGGESHAIFQLHMLPIDFSVVGTVHSHPGPNADPSQEDLEFFQRLGYIHIIVASPFVTDSWRAWDRDGNPYELSVVD